MLPAKGKVVAVHDNNSIVVTSSDSETLGRISEFIAIIDRRPGQILIEARIVEVDKKSAHEFGVAWQGERHAPSSDIFGRPGVVDNTYAVNLPTASAPAGAIGYGFVTNRHSLEMVISALEYRGEAKTVSSPRIQVLNNHKAVISDGMQFIVPKRDASTVITTSPDASRQQTEPETYSAVLELAVTPRMIKQGQVSLALDVRQEEFDFDIEVQGYPPKRMKSAQTDIMLKSGSTVVIGGITTKSTLHGKTGVPLLSKIPILGWFFKGSQDGTEESELMIFITPTILSETGP